MLVLLELLACLCLEAWDVACLACDFGTTLSTADVHITG